MSPSPAPLSAPLLTRFVFVSLILLCLGLFAGAGFVKVGIDRAGSTMVAPNEALSTDHVLHEKTVTALGYGGFLGAAQSYMAGHDPARLNDMRMAFKTAQEASARATDLAPTNTRRDVRSVIDLYENLLNKAQTLGVSPNEGLSSADLILASNALSLLENRLQAAAATKRLDAQKEHRLWATSLLFLAFGGAGMALFLTLWMNLSQRKNLAVPLDSLKQSVMRMVHGDLHSPIWGLERSDDIGLLARAMDNARLYFAQLPDLSVIDENGVKRVKFEGEQRTLFRELTQNMAETFSRSHKQVEHFASAIGTQQAALDTLTNKLNLVLNHLQQQGAVSEQTFKTLSSTIDKTTRNLSEAQDATIKQIGKIVPYLNEKAQKMSDVTQLAGTQITQALQSFVKAEGTLRSNAAQSQQTVQQLAQATNQMGERMFAALNLMQASGKWLSNTTEEIKTRFNEAVETLSKGEDKLLGMIQKTEDRLASTLSAEEAMAHIAARTESSAQKMERAVSGIHDRHEKLNEQVITAAHRMDSIVASFDSAQRSMTEAVGQIRRDGSLIANLLQDLRANNEQLLTALSQNTQTGYSSMQSLAEKSHALMQRLEVQIQQQSKMAETRIDELSVHAQTMTHHANTSTTALTQTVAALKGEQERLAATRTKFSETLDDLSTRLEHHATSTFGKTEQWAAQSFVKLTGLAEQMEGAMQRLNMLGQLTGTLGTVAGQLGQIVPTLTSYGASLPVASAPATVHAEPAPIIIDMEGTKSLIVQQAEEIVKELHDHWHKAVVQIEAMHDQLAQIVVAQKDQLETRLVVMGKNIREASESVANTSEIAEASEKQAEIINELVSAISKINDHVLELDDVIEESGLKKQA